jgi:AraC-like DNA-binding protein
LSEFIDSLWSLTDAPSHTRERIVPSGTVELVINLAEDEFRIFGPGPAPSCRRLPGAIVSGCYSTPFEIDTRDHAAVVGVHFRPGGAAGFLGAPPGELADAHVGLGDLWGREAIELHERLCSAHGSRDRFRILEQALSARLTRGHRRRSAIQRALPELDRPGAAIGRVAMELRLSRRRFIEVFTQDVGMTPKRYSRIRRFQRALAIAKRAGSPDWAGVALECGYFDQAHLCREWAEFTGITPSEFVSLRQSRVKENHLALPEEEVKPVQDASPSPT